MSQLNDVSGQSTRYLTGIERFVVLTCAIPAGTIWTIMTPVLQKIQVALATGPNDAMLVRVALTVVGFSMLVGAPMAGWIIDKIGVRLMLIGSTAFFIAFGCVGAVINDLHLLIASRFCQGLAAAAVIIAGTTILGKIPDEVQRGQLVGISIMIATVTSLVTLPISGLIGDINWHYTFLLYLIFLPAVVSATLLGKDNAVVKQPTEAFASEPGFWRTFPYRLAAISFMAGFTMYANTAYMPFRFHEVGIEKSSLIGISLTATTVTVSISAALFGVIRRWLSSETAFKVSFAVTALGELMSALIPNYWLVMAGQMVFGVGNGPMVPNILALVSATPPRTRGKVTGIVKGFNYGAGLVAAIILEPVMRFGGASAAIMAVAVIALIVTVAIAMSGKSTAGVQH